MGKGEIKDNLGDGLYRVKIKYGGRDRTQQRIDLITEQLLSIAEQIKQLQIDIEDLISKLDDVKIDPETEPTEPSDPAEKIDPLDPPLDDIWDVWDGLLPEPNEDPEEPPVGDPPTGGSSITGTVTDS